MFARTFNAFAAAVLSLRPHVIYFYGHGETDDFSTRFQFENDGAADWRGFDEISQAVSQLINSSRFPPVVWVNACQGAAAHQESALRMLAPVSSCVIATRTVIAVDDSRALARAALPLICQGRAPGSAIRQALHAS